MAKRSRSNLPGKKRPSLAEKTALYYGFKTIPPPVITKEDIVKARSITSDSDGKIKPAPGGGLECNLPVRPEEKIAILRAFEEGRMAALPQPVLLFFEGSQTVKQSQKQTGGEERFELEILGSPKSVAEAIIIQTSVAILRDEKFENLYLEINSVGDKESITKFTKELTNFYRKHLEELPAHCHQTFKHEVFDLFLCQNESCQKFAAKAPQSLSYLSEQSRAHFREVLEYLETLNIPYRINNTLIGNRHLSTHTIFEIRSIDEKNDEKAGPPLAIGFRYNNLSKKIGFKREFPAVGITVARKLKKLPSRRDLPGQAGKPRPQSAKPKIYFIQLGFEAKLQSLRVIEMLRVANIPIYQSLSKDKLVAQLTTAENMKLPYVIIMGQKEAIENSVIVRNMNNRSQETVPLNRLPTYLKHIKEYLK